MHSILTHCICVCAAQAVHTHTLHNGILLLSSALERVPRLQLEHEPAPLAALHLRSRCWMCGSQSQRQTCRHPWRYMQRSRRMDTMWCAARTSILGAPHSSAFPACSTAATCRSPCPCRPPPPPSPPQLCWLSCSRLRVLLPSASPPCMFACPWHQHTLAPHTHTPPPICAGLCPRAHHG